MRIISLGLVDLACRIITGNDWYEITYASEFITQPGQTLPQVKKHLKIITDEHGTCRIYDKDKCVQDDFVFSVKEQYYPPVDNNKVVLNVEVKAGHSEIVGDYKIAPKKLISILQKQGIMRITQQAQQVPLQNLLSWLYYY